MDSLSCCQLTKKFLDQTINYVERKDGKNYQIEFSTFKEKIFNKIKENYVTLVVGLNLLEKQKKECAFCLEMKEGWKEIINHYAIQVKCPLLTNKIYSYVFVKKYSLIKHY